MGRLFLLVGVGGFIGSIARYYSSILFGRYFSSTFPLSTLVVNVVGCLLIGIFYGLSERSQAFSPEMRLFLTTGLCGGFTTFSAFSIDGIKMIADGQWLTVSLYIGLSVIAGLFATYLGISLINIGK